MQPPASPIMVKVVETNEMSTLGDVMLQAIGLTGAVAIGALAFGLVLALLIIGYRKFKAYREPDAEPPQTQPLGLTPPAHR